jgi:C-terminal processing protease CtpA/Prc
MLSKEEAGADVALMRRALEGIHPGLYRRTPKPILDRAFADLETAVAAPISDVALYRRLSLVLAMIRCTHTKADQTEVMEAWRRDNPSHAPFRFRIVQGRMLVVSSDPAQTPLPRGAEILSINGRRTKDVIAALNPYVAIDGFTELSRAAFMADDSDLMGSDFDHFYPYVFGFPESFSLRVKDSAHSRPRTVRLSPVSFRAWVRLESGQAYRQDFADSTSWRMLSGEVGYLRIDTFVNYRKPVDAAALYARALNELRGAGARKLVVDLRENGGGSNDAALGLIDALASAPYTYQRAMRYRAVRYGEFPKYISSWGDRETLFNPAMERFTASNDGWFDLRPEFAPDVLKPRQPMSEAFKGPVTVLIGPANASGATMTAAKLRDMGRVRLVGEPSGGSADGPTAGTIFNVKLPNSGISVRVPLVFNAMEVSRFDKQGGITPDVHVPLTVADFRAGRDRALERALADLEKTSAAP